MISTDLTAKIFRVVAIAEAVTWLALLIAMFFKWVLGHEEAVAIPGMTHGVVFVAYIVFHCSLRGACGGAWSRPGWPSLRASRRSEP